MLNFVKSLPNNSVLEKLLAAGTEQDLATRNYPSRGQTASQKLFQTEIGKLFYKKVSERNHQECRIDTSSGTLAEREYWAYHLAKKLKLQVPELSLLNNLTTVQRWLNFPDAKEYTSRQGPLELVPENIFDCALFDYLSGQVDRHNANYLYNMTEKKIILIDSGFAFLKYEGSLPDYLAYFEGSYGVALNKVYNTGTRACVIKLSATSLKKLVPLRGKEETAALLQRHSKVKEVSTIGDIIKLYRRQS